MSSSNVVKSFLGGTWLATIASTVLFLSFLLEKTAYFNALNLSDPSASQNPAGWVLGLVISAILTIALIWGLVLFVSNVVNQAAALQRVKEAWEKETADLKAGIAQKEDTLRNLAQAAGKGESRVAAVLTSWDDASPDSDAEYVIEGKAASCRQQLAVLQTIASILVLIGLVGNFFGLADAVQRLPELTAASAQQSAATPQVEDQKPNLTTQSTTSQDGVTAYETKSESAAPTPVAGQSDGSDPLATPIKGISEGLSVVVVSSVMGIGGMAILLLFVAGFKSIFNSMVTEEIVLMGAEIGSLLRPSGGSAGLTEEAQEAILTLPGRIERFDKAAQAVTETFGKSGADLQVIAKSLDQLMRHEMVEAKGSYESYQQSLNQFTSVLMDERKTLESLMSRTNALCDGMEGLAQSVQAMATTTHESATNYQETQAKYEAYLRMVTELAEKRNIEFDRKVEEDRDTLLNSYKELSESHTRLVDELVSKTDKTLAEAGTGLSANTTQALQLFREEFTQKITERHEAELSALSELLTNQQTALNEMGERLSSGTVDGLDASRDAMREIHEKLLNVCDRVAETQDTALRSVVDFWTTEIGAYSDKSVAKIENGLKDIVGKLEARPTNTEDRDPSNDESWRDELRTLITKLDGLQIPQELNLSQASIEELQRPILAQSSNGEVAAPPATVVEPRPLTPERVELSEQAEQKIISALSQSIEAGLQPLINSLKNPPKADPGVWHCNICSVTNPAHEMHCPDCGASKSKAMSATPILPDAPSLQEYVAGLEHVLRKELQPLVEVLRARRPAEESTVSAPAADYGQLSQSLQELRSTTESSLHALREETAGALAAANESLRLIAENQSRPEPREQGADTDLVAALNQLIEKLSPKEEETKEEESEEETSTPSGIMGFLRRRGKK